MTSQDPSTREFMLTHYQSIYQRYYYEREILDKSLNTFLTLASAIVGGVLLLASNPVSIISVYVTVLIGLTIMLVIGLITYERVCARSVTALRWLMRANLALTFFTQTDTRLALYVRPHRINELSETWLQSTRLKGQAVARTLAILNVIFVCGIVTILTNFILQLDILFGTALNISIVLLSWLIHVIIWRMKLHKLQTIVAPSLSESASGEADNSGPSKDSS